VLNAVMYIKVAQMSIVNVEYIDCETVHINTVHTVEYVYNVD